MSNTLPANNSAEKLSFTSGREFRGSSPCGFVWKIRRNFQTLERNLNYSGSAKTGSIEHRQTI